MSESIFSKEERFQEGEYKLIARRELTEDQKTSRNNWNLYWSVVGLRGRTTYDRIPLLSPEYFPVVEDLTYSQYLSDYIESLYPELKTKTPN